MKEEIFEKYGNLENFRALFKYSRHSPKVDLTKLVAVNNEFDETHPLYKKVCVFTGALEKYTRQTAAQIVVNLGGTCGNTVTKKTNYRCV